MRKFFSKFILWIISEYLEDLIKEVEELGEKKKSRKGDGLSGLIYRINRLEEALTHLQKSFQEHLNHLQG
jgi:uncharacterized protein (UPF0335 family)